MGRYVGSLVLFAAIVGLGVLWLNGNSPDKKPAELAPVATSTPKISALPDVAFFEDVQTETIKKTAFPTGKKDPANLVTAVGEYPINTPFAKVAETHVKGIIQNFIEQYSDQKDIVTSGGVNAESSVAFSRGKKLFSYLYSDYTEEGGAHGNIQFSSETLDMNGRKYILGDLFLPKTDYLGIFSQMAIVHFVKDTYVAFDPKDATFGKGLDPKPENFAAFFISGDKIIFQFQNYQIGPYSEGPQRFEVSVKDPEISKIVRPELF